MEGFDDYYPHYYHLTECSPPPVVVPETEDGRKPTLEEQVLTLQAEVNVLRDCLERYGRIVNEFQRMFEDNVHYNDTVMNELHSRLYQHTDQFHARLIIGYKKKEGDNNEGDIS